MRFLLLIVSVLFLQIPQSWAEYISLDEHIKCRNGEAYTVYTRDNINKYRIPLDYNCAFQDFNAPTETFIDNAQLKEDYLAARAAAEQAIEDVDTDLVSRRAAVRALLADWDNVTEAQLKQIIRYFVKKELRE